MRAHLPLHQMVLGIAAVTSLLLLAACGDLFETHPAKHRASTAVSPPAAKVEHYMLNMTLARLALDNNPSDITLAKPYLKALNAPPVPKKAKEKPATIRFLTLIYTTAAQKEEQLAVVPIAADDKFAALQQIMRALSQQSYTLKNIRTYRAELLVSTLPRLGKDESEATQQLKNAQRTIMAQAKIMPLQADAELQLELTEFFIDNRIRDAAYIALDNAKHALALVEAAPKTQSSADLFDRVTALENRLHSEMPYKL